MENAPVQVKICVGTLCAVMGGSDLQLLEDFIPAAWREHVSIAGSTCLDQCKGGAQGPKPPFVSVNGEIVAQATITGIVERIGRILRGKGLIA